MRTKGATETAFTNDIKKIGNDESEDVFYYKNLEVQGAELIIVNESVNTTDGSSLPTSYTT